MAVIVSSGDTPEQVKSALEKAGLAADSVQNTGPQDSATEPKTEPAATETPAQSEPVGEKPAVADSKTAEVTETPEAKNQETEPQPRGEDGKFVSKEPDKQDGVQKRIDKAVKAQREAERKLAEAEAKLAELQATAPAKEKPEPEKPATKAAEKPAEPAPKPKLEDLNPDGTAKYATYEDWVEALSDWKTDQKVAKASEEIAKLKSELAKKEEDRVAAEKAAEAAQPAMEAYAESVERARAAHPDFTEVTESAMADEELTVTPTMQQAIFESELAGEMLYYLATNPDECKRIAKLSPVTSVRELGRIEAKLANAPAPAKEKAPAKEPEKPAEKAPENPKPKLSNAPPPISPVEGTAPTSKKDPTKMTFREYEDFLKTPEGQAWRTRRN